MGVLNLIEERARWDKLSDGELLKEISALIKQFSEIQIRLIEAKKVYALRKIRQRKKKVSNLQPYKQNLKNVVPK